MLFQQHEQSLLVHAPAKLNLFLEILGRRADGYHELDTLMIAVDLHDTLTFTETSPGVADDAIDFRAEFVVPQPASGLSLPQDANNLVIKAVELIKRETGCRRGVQIRLFKRIPLASGLGGGSSDAAATLVALNRLWQLELDDSQLHRLAAQLGSDVNFFLAPNGLAICRGRGEAIQPLQFQHHFHFVIARMHQGLSTAQVFARCKPSSQPRSAGRLIDELQRGNKTAASQAMYNALQSPAEVLTSELCELKAKFSELPVLGHSMSGSGTAYYGWCANRKLAQAAAARLRSRGVPFVVTVQSRF
ncbi:MAG: 4-(cytidine 5'-diphospho)-2-C-methyl-D-erythritol kinase [Planctomycetota bacterium]|nr:4-(cytidine 5'-diphospho)-2-C-methyl-D-erythritol kinase [Planctomycetota bacterium]MDA1212535.1 4-(cytidine 5'-diphospho)-2-C-methyl-D-erythritol kinase [Planctomycetota bacterium]